MRRTVLLIIWLVTDAALFIAAYAIGYVARVGFILSTDFPLEYYLRTVAVVAPLWVLAMAQLGIFRLTRVQSEQRNILHIFFACVLGSAMFTLAYYFLFDRFFSRLLLVYAGALSFGLTLVWHLAFDSWQRRILRKNPAAYPVLIVGLSREAEKLIRHFEERQCPLKPVAILDPQGSPLKEVAGVPVLGKLNKLEDVIKEKRPTHLIQCSSLEHTINLMSVCRQHGMTYMLLPSVLGVAGGGEVVSVEGYPLLTARG